MDKKQKHDRQLIDQMGELGFLGVSIPEEYGGGGFDYISTGIVSEELENLKLLGNMVPNPNIIPYNFERDTIP